MSDAARLQLLRAALRRLAAGGSATDIELPPDYDAHDSPAASLVAEFNAAMAALREREAVRSVFGQYVRPDVADALLRGEVPLAGERREVTALITDIRGFTVLTDTLAPERLVALLNRYLGRMVDAVVEFDGTLDQYMGDAMIIEFNAPVAQDFHALRAVLAALRMREHLAAFNRDQAARGEPELLMGMGIHTGLAIFGNIGSDGRRVQYTAIGDAVNCAARMESEAKTLAVDIVLSGATYARVADWVLVGDSVDAAITWRDQPLAAHAVLGLRPGLTLGPHLLDLARERAGTAPAPVDSEAAAGERRRLLEELDGRIIAQRATLEAVMGSMSEGLLVLDTRRQVRFCNDRAAAVLGTTRAALTGLRAEAIFDRLRERLASPDAVRTAWERALAAPGTRPSFEVRLAGRGAPVYVGHVFPVVDERAGSVPVGAGLALRDVTAVELENERKQLELEHASAIQRRLLPSSMVAWPGVLEIAHRFRPAVETSGDFYDVLRLTPPTEGALPPLQIAVGDVAGKGMAAALVTALARAALQASASVPPGMATPAATLRVAGQRMHRDVGSGHFVACALAVVEPPGRHNAGPLLRLANAAQIPVLLVRDGASREVVPPGYRLPLGAEDDGAYEDAKVELRPGDVVIFSSDGLVEAPALGTTVTADHLPPPAKKTELFGFARLASSVTHWSTHAASAEAIAAGIWSDLTSWCGDQSHHDDMTLLVLRVS